MTTPSKPKKTETKDILEVIKNSAGFLHGKEEKKDVFVKTKVQLKPESLESREMLSVNPLDGDWFQSNDFVKFDLSESRASAMASVLEEAGGLSEGGILDVPNEWLIQLSNDLISRVGNVEGATRHFQSLGITVVEGLGSPGSLHVVIGGGTAADQRLKLSSIVGITGFEPNQMLVSAATNVQDAVNDPKADQLWNLNIARVPDAWNYVPAGSPGTTEVIVAVLDTGVNINHPDLKDNIWVNTAELNGKADTDNDGNGFKNDVYGWNFYSNNNNVLDDNGHGTHVAGTIAAVGDNAIGIVGVAPNAKILPLKFLNASGNGFSSDATRAINYTTALKLAGNNIVAINCSFGSTGAFPTLTTAILNAGSAGIVVVAAAGNESSNLDVTKVYPASVDASNVITVGATTNTDAWASYSNYGSAVDVAAPGSNIYSTVGSSYGLKSGTSMATPFVSGMVALVAATNPNLTPEQIKAAIVAGVDQLPHLANKVSSGGRVNAANTLALVAGNPSGVILSLPSGVTATTVGASSLNLSWNADNSATGYILERSANGSDGWEVVYQGAQTSFTDTGLPNGTAQYYRVTATATIDGQEIQSRASKVFSAKTNIGSAQAFAPTTVGSTSVALAWIKAVGSTATYIEYADSPEGPWTTINCTSAVTKTISGLTANTDYYFRTYSTSSTETSATSQTYKIHTAPATPTGLKADSKTNDSITMTWTASEGATSSQLQMALTSSGPWTTIYTGAETNYTITGLDSLTSYYFRVACSSGQASPSFDIETLSANTGTATVKTNADAPLSPENLTATTATTTAITLTWTTSLNATSYTLEYATSEDGPWTTAYTGSALTRTVSSLTADTNYFFRISASNVTGFSSVSETISARTLVKAPTAPTGLKAVANGANAINVSWNETVNATEYTLEYALASTGPWTTAYTGADTACSVSDLDSSTTYYFRVKAGNTTGVSGNSGTVNTKTAADSSTPLVAPTMPSGLTASASGTSQINVSWNAVSGATSYKLEAQVNGTWTTIYTGSATSFTNTGLTANTQYTYRVSAVNAAGTSAASGTVAANTNEVPPVVTPATPVTPVTPATPETTTPSSPNAMNFTWTQKAGNAMTFQWNAIPNATSYTVQYSTNDGTSWNGAANGAAVTATSYTGSFSSATDYLLRIRATVPGGFTDWVVIPFTRSIADFKVDFNSTPVVAPTTPTPVTPVTPVTPSGLAASASSTSQINVSWNAVSGAASYKLEVQAAGSNTWTTIYTGNATSFANTGLTANTQYTYRISAVNDGGTSAVSSIVSAKTLTALPATPTGLAVNNGTATTSTLGISWNTVADATSYKLEVQIGGTWTTIYSGSDTNFTHTGLTNNTSYNYRVSAVNSVGISEVSSMVSGKTKNK